MNRLVVYHIYANGAACDFPGYRNHGLPFDATDTPAPDAPGFTYASEDSRVSVPPGNSLQDLLPARAVVSFNLNPEGGLTRSCYLIEGRASFGLAVEPDGSLQGHDPGRRRKLDGGAEPGAHRIDRHLARHASFFQGGTSS